MSEYANYIGRKIDNIDKLKENFDSFNHIMPLEAKQIFSVSLRGWFYTNISNGDNYVISEYGIAKFSKNGMDWVINSENTIQKFIQISKKISDSFIDSENIYDTKFKVRDKLGL